MPLCGLAGYTLRCGRLFVTPLGTTEVSTAMYVPMSKAVTYTVPSINSTRSVGDSAAVQSPPIGDSNGYCNLFVFKFLNRLSELNRSVLQTSRITWVALGHVSFSQRILRNTLAGGDRAGSHRSRQLCDYLRSPRSCHRLQGRPPAGPPSSDQARIRDTAQYTWHPMQ